MDIRAYYGLNNYWEPIEDNYINSYPNCITRSTNGDKFRILRSLVNRIYALVFTLYYLVLRSFFKLIRGETRRKIEKFISRFFGF